jgi:hypothetical protein
MAIRGVVLAIKTSLTPQLVIEVTVRFFFLFVLTIVLSVLLRNMDSDYPFAIFKLFLLYFIDEKIPQMH